MRTILLLSSLLLACTPSPSSGGEGASGHPKVGPLDIVTARDYGRLTIEIDAVDGKGPTPRALELFELTLNDLVLNGQLEKPNGVEVIVDDDSLPPHAEDAHEYGTDEQHALSAAARDLPREEGTAYLHMLYLDGHTELDDGDSRVLGYAYGGSYIAMFRDSIDGACASSTVLDLLAPSVQQEACDVTEAGVLVHEVGHLFGLVNNGLDMVTPHQDEAHGAHDDDQDCIMYWLAERSDAVDVVADRFLSGETGVPPFDDDCLADLEAAIAGSSAE